jgi:hypothetical protein
MEMCYMVHLHANSHQVELLVRPTAAAGMAIAAVLGEPGMLLHSAASYAFQLQLWYGQI